MKKIILTLIFVLTMTFAFNTTGYAAETTSSLKEQVKELKRENAKLKKEKKEWIDKYKNQSERTTKYIKKYQESSKAKYNNKYTTELLSNIAKLESENSNLVARVDQLKEIKTDYELKIQELADKIVNMNSQLGSNYRSGYEKGFEEGKKEAKSDFSFAGTFYVKLFNGDELEYDIYKYIPTDTLYYPLQYVQDDENDVWATWVETGWK